MTIFSRKSKAKKEDERKRAADTSEEKPKPAYKHVPTHAAADSAGQGGRTDDSHQIAQANRRRIANSMFDSTLNNASYAQEIAHNMAHGTPPPASSGTGQQRFSPMQRNYSENALFANMDVRQMVASPAQRPQSASAPRHRMSRSSSDYCTPFGVQSSLDSSVTKGKRPLTSAGPGYTNNSSDSGYESAGPPSAMHSRTPSECNLQEHSISHLARSSSGFLLPELKLGDVPMAEQLSTDVGESAIASEGVLKNGGSVPQLDLAYDQTSTKSTKSTNSVSKRTRFEDDADPMPALNQLEAIRTSSSSTPPLAEPSISLAREEHDKTLNKGGFECQKSPQADGQQSAFTAPAALPTTPLTGTATPLSTTRSGSLAPLSVLEGFKVNKKGKILDEEGDTIGELIKGDLLDCVRQKANACGEVVDEYGRVVGAVCTVPRLLATSRFTPELRSQQLQHASAFDTAADVAALPQARRDEAVPMPMPTVQQPVPSADAHAPASALVAPITTHLPNASSPRHLPSFQARDFAAEIQAPQSNVSSQGQMDTLKRSVVARSASERSLSELSKQYARPTMSSVPENKVPEDDVLLETSGAFAYKGDIPSVDGPTVSIRRRSQSPPLPSQSRPIFAGSHSSSTMLMPSRPGAGMNSRRSTTQFTGGPLPCTGATSRHPAFAALKKSSSNTFGESRSSAGLTRAFD